MASYEHYFANHEDADFSIRTWRLGLRVVNVPDAIALHRYEFSRNPNKFYLVERNRLMFVLHPVERRGRCCCSRRRCSALELAMVAAGDQGRAGCGRRSAAGTGCCATGGRCGPVGGWSSARSWCPTGSGCAC